MGVRFALLLSQNYEWKWLFSLPASVTGTEIGCWWGSGKLELQLLGEWVAESNFFAFS